MVLPPAFCMQMFVLFSTCLFLRIDLFGYGAEFIVPRLAETTNEGVFQELINFKTQATTVFDGRAANVPTVVLQPYESACKAFFANGIKRTGYGFAPLGATFAKGLVGGAKAATFGAVTGEHAVLAVDDASHEVAFAIGIGHAFAVDDALGSSTEIVPHIVEHVFEFAHFVEGKGGSAVAFNAANAFAGIKVAAKMFGQNFGGENYVAYLQYHNFEVKYLDINKNTEGEKRTTS